MRIRSINRVIDTETERKRKRRVKRDMSIV